MITREQIFRALQTIAVPVVLGLIARQIWGDTPEDRPASLYLPLLADIDFAPRQLPVTYRFDAPEIDAYERVSIIQNATTGGKPEVTAVVLNWSRFPNVMLITSLLCAPWLEGTISQILIWNNNPIRLTYEEMKNTGCSRSRLRIHNSPANLLFQARYLACAQAESAYCFFQDDDYLIHPEIIQTLYARISEPGASRAIHLLPPHEHLSTILREIHVPVPDGSDIHTSFAWLGHGTMLRRSEAQQFLDTLRTLQVTAEDMRMADNFFTILSNRVPEVWFDQGFELGGGTPFTMGSAGDERNKYYTLRAAQYLQSIIHCGHASCEDNTSEAQPTQPKLSYVNFAGSVYSPDNWTHSACRGAACVLDTNISSLPEEVSHTAASATDILSSELRNTERLGNPRKQNYLEHPPSHAVDMKPDTVFRSLSHAAQGDMILLDILMDVSNSREWTTVELVWLVDFGTENTLRACTFEWSPDNVSWHTVSHSPICYDTGQKATVEGTQVGLRECSVQMLLGSSGLLRSTGRYFRVRVEEDGFARWMISELWLRGF